jgi:hypothetical protein
MDIRCIPNLCVWIVIAFVPGRLLLQVLRQCLVEIDNPSEYDGL